MIPRDIVQVWVLPRTRQCPKINPALSSHSNHKGGAYAGAFFSDARIKSRDWLTELILVDYQVGVFQSIN